MVPTSRDCRGATQLRRCRAWRCYCSMYGGYDYKANVLPLWHIVSLEEKSDFSAFPMSLTALPLMGSSKHLIIAQHSDRSCNFYLGAKSEIGSVLFSETTGSTLKGKLSSSGTSVRQVSELSPASVSPVGSLNLAWESRCSKPWLMDSLGLGKGLQSESQALLFKEHWWKSRVRYSNRPRRTDKAASHCRAFRELILCFSI